VNSFDYDDNGAIVAKKDGAGSPVYTLVRDDQGQVVSASGPGFSDTFGYDPQRLRVRRGDSSGTHLFHHSGLLFPSKSAAASCLEISPCRLDRPTASTRLLTSRAQTCLTRCSMSIAHRSVFWAPEQDRGSAHPDDA
jgi:YD repeat-containing protein